LEFGIVAPGVVVDGGVAGIVDGIVVVADGAVGAAPVV